MVGLQILASISTLLILIFRSYVCEMFLKHLMQDFYIDVSTKDIMDTVQLNVSFNDQYNIVNDKIILVRMLWYS